jgi:ubiquinone/menaquinone biosynthesis C-methylase UbiE
MPIYFSSCPNCGSDRYHTWGVTVGRDRLHEIQSKCSQCGLIFANPQADQETLHQFYNQEYEGGVVPDYLDVKSQHMQHADKIRRLRTMCPHGVVLDIGAGNGSFLHAAHEMGYDVVGLEPASEFVEYIKKQWGIDTILHTTFEQHHFSDASFDIVYAWHVIEHVPDIEYFINEIHRILKPGGIALIGTEGHQFTGSYVDRFRSYIRGSCPPFVSSHEHTYLFSKQSLKSCWASRGFAIEYLRAYHNSLTYRLRFLTFSTRISKFVMPIREWRTSVPHLIDRCAMTGDRLELYVRKTESVG